MIFIKKFMPVLLLGLLPSVGYPAVAARRQLPAQAAAAHPDLAEDPIPAKQVAFRNVMRKLWEEHIVWTRQFIVSSAANLPDKGTASDRLMHNQVDIGNAIKPYFGQAAGEKLTVLLKEHIATAADVVAASKTKDSVKMQEANLRWFANASAIAAFLSAANPKHWPAAEMKTMMHEHLNHTATELQARLKGDWAADIAAYDQVHEHTLRMADMLSAGIIGKYPQQLQ